jgi:hypothetical protein
MGRTTYSEIRSEPITAVPPPAKGQKSLPAGGSAIGIDAKQTQQMFECSPVHLFADPLEEAVRASQVANHNL